MINKLGILFAILLIAPGLSSARETADNSFDSQWRFIRQDVPGASALEFDDSAWEVVTLPHTANLEALLTGPGNPQWQGICWYRKTFDLPVSARDKIILLRFDGAMNAAEIWINGKSAGNFMGGYLPYVADISKFIRAGRKNVVAVRLDNRDNPITGPKPEKDLDFNLYGGLYRDVHLVIKDKIHITDPILADKVAGGGIFITFPTVSKDEAALNVKTQIKNEDEITRTSSVKTAILDASGKVVALTVSDPQELAAGADREVMQEIRVVKPKLWSPKNPCLYQVRSELIEKNKTLETRLTRIGIRQIQISKDGLRINGEKMFLRGANRHQQYPYIGNALSDAAQYRDALKIKEAGFDFVRLSHYPQSPAFLDACDELGLVVMDSLMGWQYFNPDPAFTDLKLRECRELVRRDRNHPSVILWEVSLNESDMPESFIRQASAIAHEEYPGDQCFTCGWQKGYDVFIEARQHGGCVGITNQPCLVSEYGDWEYYAQNAGFEQEKWKDLQSADRNSRQLRGDGDVRLLQQALNFQEAHNDNLKTSAFADCVWVMFDYNRGYADDLESSGVMDIFRLPKFSYWFYRSQRDADELVVGKKIGPVIFIANDWTADSPTDVRVFSNCEEVALYLNGKFIERRRPDVSRVATNLKHPPFTFRLGQFRSGELKAVGFIGGRKVAACERRTPGEATQLALEFDTNGRPFAAGGKDVVFCHASLKDKDGTVISTAKAPVFFGTTGQMQFVGDNPAVSEGGIATVLAESNGTKTSGAVFALCLLRQGNQIRALSAAAAPEGGAVPKYQIRYTTDGSESSNTSHIYLKPMENSATLQAALFVEGRAVVHAGARLNTARAGDKVSVNGTPAGQ